MLRQPIKDNLRLVLQLYRRKRRVTIYAYTQREGERKIQFEKELESPEKKR